MKSWKKNIIQKSLALSASISSFIGVILSFIEYPENKWWIGLVIFLSTFVVLFVATFIFKRNIKHHRITKRGSIFVEAMYGDILKIKTKKNKKPVVVIPVNSSFDSVVEDDLNKLDRIIEGSSIHGQWLNKYAPNRESLEVLQKDISDGIANRSLSVVKTLPKKRGNKEVYNKGSYIFVERNDCSFLLFALTEFDENNKVIKSDAEAFVELMSLLMNATDYCAGKHVYIPIMGNKIALFGLNTLQSFEYIKNAALNKRNSLRASISIVIFDNDREDVSIYD